jgi:cell fate regulator YaaT (PSP1 superfamily)
MKVAEIQFVPWDKAYWFNFSGHELKVGERVVVRTELGTELGEVIGFSEVVDEKKEKEIKSIIRKANLSDLSQFTERNKKRTEALVACRRMVAESGLNMKIIDAHFSFDGGRLTFAFIADGRLDFRDLVKNLTHTFQKSIRLQQLGVRDEAKLLGSCGPCGEQLCCQKFLRSLGQVSSECAEVQQAALRGSERLSGMCGRLKCCLRYEKETYEELIKKLPAIGTRVRTDQGRGVIIGHQILKQSVVVRLDPEKGDGNGSVAVVPIKN